MEEIWKDIKGYEGLYQVSNLGRVRSLNRMCWNGNSMWEKQGRIIKTNTNSRGYLRVPLTIDAKSNYTFVHRLVAEAFIPNPQDKATVDHIDRDYLNNTISNLRWATPVEQRANQRDNSIGVYLIYDTTDRYFSSISSLCRYLEISTARLYERMENGICKYKEYTIEVEY